MFGRLVLQRAALVVALLLPMAGCRGPSAAQTSVPANESASGATFGVEVAAESLQPAARAAGEKLHVVATTNLIGDALQRVGGDHVALSVLLPVGADPHTYVATPRDLVALDGADVIFANGLGLEEALLPALAGNSTAPVVSVNEKVTPLIAGASGAAGGERASLDGGHDHGLLDPHTWQDARNVALWATTIATALARLDPEHASDYAQAGAAYARELNALHEELAAQYATIPPAHRVVVTDHDDLAYLGNAYGLRIVGSVVPSFSTMASVSARDRSALETQIGSEGVKAILLGATVNPRLARQLAQDSGVPIVTIDTDSLGSAGGPAATYPALMRHNAQALVDALK